MGVSLEHIVEYYPEKCYTNDDFFNEFPELKQNEENLFKVGISNRYIVNRTTTASDLTFFAAEKLFTEYGYDRSEIDFLIFCATEFDHYTPNTAPLLQHRLKLRNTIGAIDIVSNCTAFVQCLSLINGLIEGNNHKNVLLLCASTVSKIFHPKDANSKYLFGDAATACILRFHDHKNFGQFVFGTDGSRAEYIMVRDGAGRNKLAENSFIEEINEFGNITTRAHLNMNGSGIFLFGIQTVPKLINDILIKNNCSFEEIDFFVLHQANKFLLETLQRKMAIPSEKFIICMEHTGNTVAASIPIALNSLLKAEKIKSGDKVLIAAFGTGLTWGGTILNF